MPRLVVPAHLDQLATLREFAATELAAAGFEEEAGAMILALDEAATNAIVHGYADQPGDIELRIEFEGDEVVATLLDDAPTHNPLNAPEPDLSLPLEQRPIGGLGVDLVKTLTDHQEHRSRGESGNALTLRKRRMSQTRNP
ncbi:MAG: ATP-binding protein [Fimbriimonadaceae bacterium]|nr:ATP-binding protein [Fimbriimonadaceae bacterium]